MNTYIMREPVFMYIWIHLYIWGGQINTCKSTQHVHVCVYVNECDGMREAVCVCVWVCHSVSGWLHALICASDLQKAGKRGGNDDVYTHASCVNAKYVQLLQLYNSYKHTLGAPYIWIYAHTFKATGVEIDIPDRIQTYTEHTIVVLCNCIHVTMWIYIYLRVHTNTH